MNTTSRAAGLQRFLEAADHLLVPCGYKRRSKSQEWTKLLDSANEAWVHLNFGKGIVNPSFGVRFLDLQKLISKIPAPTSTVQMLGHLFEPPRSYSLDDATDLLIQDLRSELVPRLEQLGNRPAVIERLKASSVKDWPVISYSDRIRILPLLLFSAGEKTEALRVGHEFLIEVEKHPSMDQIVPRYNVFLTALNDS